MKELLQDHHLNILSSCLFLVSVGVYIAYYHLKMLPELRKAQELVSETKKEWILQAEDRLKEDLDWSRAILLRQEMPGLSGDNTDFYLAYISQIKSMELSEGIKNREIEAAKRMIDINLKFNELFNK